jgi:hypothetical protein
MTRSFSLSLVYAPEPNVLACGTSKYNIGIEKNDTWYSEKGEKSMRSRTRDLLTGLFVLSLITIAVPAVGASGSGQSWADNPEHIAAMQAFTAYSGQLFKDKMNGAIQYIGTLNGSVSTSSLQSDEQQFLATVASVQSMTTSDAITQAWGTMKDQIAQFRTDLKTALTAGKGSETALAAAVNSSVSADQTNIQSLDNTYWTDRETSRLDEFSYNDGRRTGIIANLTAKGIDAGPAQAIETQIQALQPTLKSDLDARNDGQLIQVNSQLNALNQQLATEVESLAWQFRETTRLAQFDNTTTRMQDRLANLTARNLDVSSAQSILSQIISIRPQLQTALENHDEATLRSINQQLVSLDQQYNQALRAIISQARAETNRTSMGRRVNQSAISFSYGARANRSAAQFNYTSRV